MLLLLNVAPNTYAKAGTDDMLHTEGNRIVDYNGQTVRLFGMNCPGLEWMTASGDVTKAVAAAFDRWEANLVRLPMNQDFWFGYHSSQTDDGAAYRKQISDIAAIAQDRGKYLWLDLHWSNAGTEWGKHTGQHKMPDGNSLVFWKSVAKEYKNHPYVLFGLYNEPYDIAWSVWKNGGRVFEDVNVTENNTRAKKNVRYNAVGMQTLINAIRAQEANNLIIVGGLDWGFDLSNATNDKYKLTDTPEGNGIAYDTHPYPWKSKNWSALIDKTGEKFPVIVGEFGAKPDDNDPQKPDESTFKNYYKTLFDWIDKHQYSYAAWAFHPSAGPCIIQSWNYEPTPYHGVFVKAFLQKTAASGC